MKLEIRNSTRYIPGYVAVGPEGRPAQGYRHIPSWVAKGGKGAAGWDYHAKTGHDLSRGWANIPGAREWGVWQCRFYEQTYLVRRSGVTQWSAEYVYLGEDVTDAVRLTGRIIERELQLNAARYDGPRSERRLLLEAVREYAVVLA